MPNVVKTELQVVMDKRYVHIRDDLSNKLHHECTPLLFFEQSYLYSNMVSGLLLNSDSVGMKCVKYLCGICSTSNKAVMWLTVSSNKAMVHI